MSRSGSAATVRIGPSGDLGPCPVERSEEEARIAAALAAHQLVTLVGGPGAGKSALARATARSWRGPVVEVDPSAPLAADLVRARFAGLVVIDDADDHLAALASALPGVLQALPGARVLVTAREPIGLVFERPLAIGGLAIDSAVDHLALAVERWRWGEPLATAERELAREIAEQLGGAPLAIELAAEAAAAIGVAALAAHLRRGNVDLLATERRDLPERHRTLRAAAAWSWSRLPPGEREAAARLSVFIGWFDEEAGQALAGAAAPIVALDRRSVLERRRLDPGTAHEAVVYRLPLAFRALGGETLGAEELERCRLRHAAHYLGRARDLVRGGEPAERERLTTRLAGEMGAAIRNVAASQPGVAAELVTLLEPVLAAGGASREVREHIEIGLAAARDSGVPLLIGRLLVARAHLGDLAGDRRGAAIDLEEAAALAATACDPALEAQVAIGQAIVCFRENDFTRGDQRAVEAVASARRAGDGALLARATFRLAMMRHRLGRTDEAAGLYEDAIAAALGAGDLRHAACALDMRGALFLELDQEDRARAALTDAIQLHRRIENRAGEANATGNLAVLDSHRGHFEAAERSLRRAAELAEACRTMPLLAMIFARLSALLMVRGELDEAEAILFRALAAARAGEHQRPLCLVLGQLGILAHLRDDLERARARFAEALALDDGALGSPTAAVVAAHAAAVSVRLGDGAGAARLLERARPAAIGYAAAVATVDALGCFIALADAIEAAREGRHRQAHTFLAEARVAVGSPASPAADRVLATRLAERAIAETARSIGCLRIARDGAWVAWPGRERVTLAHRPTLCRLLDLLLAARIDTPGVAVSIERLREAGWPGDQGSDDSLANRLRVAMTHLRKLALGDVLRAGAGGYLLDPVVDVAVD